MLSLEHGGVDLFLAVEGLAHHCRSSDVCEVPVPHGTDVDEAQVAVADDLVSDDAVRGRHVPAGSHERRDDMSHLAAEVIQGLHRVARYLALPHADARGFDGSHGDAVAGRVRLLDKGPPPLP